MKDYNNITNFEELIEREHGKIGSESRNKYEENAQMFIISAMLKEARKEAKLTQEQLAERSGTKKKLYVKIGKRQGEYSAFHADLNFRAGLE